MNNKHYIWGGVKKLSNNYWEMFIITAKLEDLASCQVNEKGYIKLKITERKQPGKFWETHTLMENDYQGTGGTQQETGANENKYKWVDTSISIEDVPF